MRVLNIKQTKWFTFFSVSLSSLPLAHSHDVKSDLMVLSAHVECERMWALVIFYLFIYSIHWLQVPLIWRQHKHTHMHSCFANRALLTQRAHFFCVPKMIKIPFRNSTGNYKASTRTFTQNKCLRLTSTYRSRELTDSNNDWMCAVWFGKRHMYATT